MASAKIRKNQATGIFVTKDALIVTTARKSGHETTSVRFDEGQVSDALNELLEAGGLPGRIVCAIEPRHLFGLARQITSRLKGDKLGGAGELLPARLNNLRGGVVSGFTTVKLPAGQHALLVACPRPAAEELLAGLPGRRPTNLRLASAPTVVAGLAVGLTPRPKKWLTHLRILPGLREGLVFLMHGDVPVAWRMIEGGDAGLGASCQAAAMSLVNHARDDLGIESIDGALMHIGDDVTGIASQLAEALSLPVQAVKAVRVDPQTTSLALAQHGLRFPKDDVDLFRELQPPGDLRQNFPYQIAAALWAFIALLGSGLWWESELLFAEARDIEAEATEALDEVGIDALGLDEQYVDLKNEVGQAEAFIVNRVYWSSVLEKLPALLPESFQLTELRGEDTIIYPTDQGMGRDIFSRRLVITGEAELVEGMNNPPEAKQIGEALQREPAIGQAFGEVLAPDIARSKYQNVAVITVRCQPPDPDS